MEFSEEESKQIFKIFKDESEEHIKNMNQCLLDIEKNPEDMDLITEMFREAHSIKGSARMLEVVSIQTLAHKIEDLLGFAKEGTVVINSQMVDLICKGMDVISQILEKLDYNTLDYVDESSNALSEEIESLKDTILSGKLQNNQDNKQTNDEEKMTSTNVVEKTKESDNIEFQPKSTNLTNSSTNTNTELDIISHYINQLGSKYKKDNAILEITSIITNKLDENIPDTNKNILKLILENIEYIKENNIISSPETIQALSDSLSSAIAPKPEEDLILVMQRQTILKQMLELSRENDKILSLPQRQEERKQIENKIDPQHDTTKKQSGFNKENTYETGGIFKTLRVDTQKLDKLENQVEELIVFKIKNKQHLNTLNTIINELIDIQKLLGKTLSNYKYTDKKVSNPQFAQEKTSYLKNSLSHVEKIGEKADYLYALADKFQKRFLNDDIRLNFLTEEFENTVKSIRILPLATIFHMLPRMVRDISREQSKQVEMIITGSETSADKTVIEEIKSPLIHIIRNAIDHGIETPEERISKGKNPTGKILLNSYHAGNTIIIEVIDDGRGINIDKIREKALKRNLLTPEEISQLSATQIMNLIFWPGFTTDDKVTEISGRGVGLDVVHTKIAQLDGKVSIQSEEGAGFKIIIKIPITLATLKALLVKIEEQIFAISSSYVKTVMSVSSDEIISKEGKPQIIYNDTSIKLEKLSDLLSIKKEEQNTNKHNIVVVNVEETLLAIEVDSFVRTEEILQKKLNPPLTRVKNISGVSSLSGGETCLILNLNDIMKSAVSSKELSKNSATLTLKSNKTSVPKILIVDDSYTTITLGKNILKSGGFNVFTATNGEDAMSIMSYEKIDLVITDLEMPVMTGIELIEKMRNMGLTMPIIVLSSHGNPKIKDECLSKGANAFIAKKDFSERFILESIKEQLKL